MINHERYGTGCYSRNGPSTSNDTIRRGSRGELYESMSHCASVYSAMQSAGSRDLDRGCLGQPGYGVAFGNAACSNGASSPFCNGGHRRRCQ